MSAEDALMTRARMVQNGFLFSALATLLVACGGGSTPAATTPTPAPTPPPAAVTGVAIPNSVAVVTATNAG